MLPDKKMMHETWNHTNYLFVGNDGAIYRDFGSLFVEPFGFRVDNIEHTNKKEWVVWVENKLKEVK